MIAVTNELLAVRKLQKDILHIKLTFEYDSDCEEFVLRWLNELPKWMTEVLFVAINAPDIKSVCEVQDDVNMLTDVVTYVLDFFNQYRRTFCSFTQCRSCNLNFCNCKERYLINNEMIKYLNHDKYYINHEKKIKRTTSG